LGPFLGKGEIRLNKASAERTSGSFLLYDLLVAVLAIALVVFLVITTGIRSHQAEMESRCKDELMALAQAQQLYLVKNGSFSNSLEDLRPFLEEEGYEKMSFVCPISEKPYRMLVEGQKYTIVAPGTEFRIDTGDPNW
jgi:competence protein ComGC